MLTKAILKSFDSVAYKATVQVVGSLATWLENVPVSRGIPSAEMVAERTLALFFFEQGNPADAVVIAIYTP